MGFFKKYRQRKVLQEAIRKGTIARKSSDYKSKLLAQGMPYECLPHKMINDGEYELLLSLIKYLKKKGD